MLRKTLYMAVLALLCALLLVSCAPAPAAAPAPTPAEQAAPTPAPAPTEDPAALCALPDLIFETEAYALSCLRARGAFAVVEYAQTDSIPAGLVLSQGVEAGLCAESGKPVALTVSKAVEPTPTPTPSPTPKPTPKEEEPAYEIVYIEEPTPDPNFPTVTPQPTWDPEVMMFMNAEAGSGMDSDCGG